MVIKILTSVRGKLRGVIEHNCHLVYNLHLLAYPIVFAFLGKADLGKGLIPENLRLIKICTNVLNYYIIQKSVRHRLSVKEIKAH